MTLSLSSNRKVGGYERRGNGRGGETKTLFCPDAAGFFFLLGLNFGLMGATGYALWRKSSSSRCSYFLFSCLLSCFPAKIYRYGGLIIRLHTESRDERQLPTWCSAHRSWLECLALCGCVWPGLTCKKRTFHCVSQRRRCAKCTYTQNTDTCSVFFLAMGEI